MPNGTCRGCGASIVWVKTEKGKHMPCNPQLVPYWERPGAAGKIILQQSGRVVSCEFDGPREEVTGFGYISHFSTCPQSRQLKELSRYYRLHMRLERNLEMLQSLENAAHPGAQSLTGMPHAVGVTDKVGDLAVEIADLKNRIRALQAELDREETKLNRFISTIENDQTRTIFRLRFLRCLTWREVAFMIGGRNTEAGVKSICYRYLESCNAVLRGDA